MPNLLKLFLFTFSASSFAASLKYTQEWVGTDSLCQEQPCAEMFQEALQLLERNTETSEENFFDNSGRGTWAKTKITFVHTTKSNAKSKKRFGVYSGKSLSLAKTADGERRNIYIAIYWDEFFSNRGQRSEAEIFAALSYELAFQLYGVVGFRVNQSWAHFSSTNPTQEAFLNIRAANHGRRFLNQVIHKRERIAYGATVKNFRALRPIAELRFNQATRHFYATVPCETRTRMGFRGPGRPPRARPST